MPPAAVDAPPAELTQFEGRQAELHRRLSRLSEAQALNARLLEEVCAKQRRELEEARAASMSASPAPRRAPLFAVAAAGPPALHATPPRGSPAQPPATASPRYESTTSGPAASPAAGPASMSPRQRRMHVATGRSMSPRCASPPAAGVSPRYVTPAVAPSPRPASPVRLGVEAVPAGARRHASPLKAARAPPSGDAWSGSPPRYRVPPLSADGLAAEVRALQALREDVRRELAWHESTAASLESVGVKDLQARRQGARRLRGLHVRIAKLQCTFETLTQRWEDAEYMLHTVVERGIDIDGAAPPSAAADAPPLTCLGDVQALLDEVAQRNEARLAAIDKRLGILDVEEEVAHDDAAAPGASPRRGRSVLDRIAAKRADLLLQKKRIVLTLSEIQAQQHAYRRSTRSE